MKELIKLIKKSKRVGIIAHVSPDADCLGSMTALSSILKGIGKEVRMFIDANKISDKFNFFNFPNDINAEIDAKSLDTIITVDVPSVKLLGKYYNLVKDFDNTICIDHHKNRDLMLKFNYVDDLSSSCSEIIYNLAKMLKVKIDKQTANYIFAGIIGDTNCFENDNTNSNTHLVASELYKLEVDACDIIFKFHKYQSESEIKIKNMLFSNIKTSGEVSYSVFTTKMQKEAGDDDIGNSVNEILNSGRNKIAFVIKQKEKNTYTVSFRCKKGYDVAIIASKYGGGGHTQASGMSFIGAPARYGKMILDDCLEQIRERDNV